MNQCLDDKTIAQALTKLPGWRQAGNALEQEFVFADFVEAFSFMTRVALISESLNHHPEWTNVYNRVKMRIWTHSAGGITQKDLALASAVNSDQ